MARKKNDQNEQAASLTSSDSFPDLDAIEAEIKADLDAIAAEEAAKAEAEPASEKPKKRGRKPKGEQAPLASIEEAAEPMNVQLNPEDLEEWLALPFNMYFSRQEKKPLTNIEKKALSIQTAKVLNKYLPMVASRYADLIGLGVCIGSIFMARIPPPEIKPEEEKPRTIYRNPATTEAKATGLPDEPGSNVYG